MKKSLSRKNLYATVCLLAGFLFLLSGMIAYYNETNSSKMQKKETYATGDSFTLTIDSDKQLITSQENVQFDITLEDLDISSGDKGIGVVYFKLVYDKDAFTYSSEISSVANVTRNSNTEEFVLTINNGNVIKSDTKLLTISLTSKSSYSNNSTTVGLTDIYGSSGAKVRASDSNVELYFEMPENTNPTEEDTSAPTVSFSNNGNTHYEKSVTTEVEVLDDNINPYSLKYLWTDKIDNPSKSEFGVQFKTQNNKKNITKSTVSGIYRLCIYAADYYNHETIECSNSFMIDGVRPSAPIISGTAASNTESQEDVILDISLEQSASPSPSGIQKVQYSINGGVSWTDYNSQSKLTISEEGLTNVVARVINGAGVEGMMSDPYVVKIVKPKMNLFYYQSTTNTTNQDVTSTISSDTQLRQTDGWELSEDGYSISKTYSDNTTEQLGVTDIHNNNSTITVDVNNIDKTLPTVETKYTRKNNTVEVTLNTNKPVKAMAGWERSTDKMTLTRTYYSNCNEELDIEDMAGNTVSTNISITSIVENFSISISYDTSVPNQITATIASDIALEPLEDWDLSSDKKILTKTYTTAIDDEIIIDTEAGWKKTISLLCSLPKEEMSLDIHYSEQKKTNQDIIVTISSNYVLQELEGWTLSLDKKGLSRIYTSNAEDTITIYSTENDAKEITIKISNIDKTPPEIIGIKNNGVYEKVELEFNKDIKEITILKDQKPVSYNIGDKLTLTDDGNYTISLLDEAGNKTSYNIVITKDPNLLQAYYDSINEQITNVPNTTQEKSKIFIILGLIELLAGLLVLFKFKGNYKLNIAVVLAVVIIGSFNRSYAADTTQFTLNGYSVVGDYLYGVEANTTIDDIRSNFDNSDSLQLEKTAGLISTGDKVTYNSKRYNVVISGDINASGKVDNTDVTSLKQYIVSSNNFDEITSEAAEYNNDGEVDIDDLYLINKRVQKNNHRIKPKGIAIRTGTNSSSSGKISVEIGHPITISTKVYPVNAEDKGMNYNVTTNNNVSVKAQGDNIIITGQSSGNATVRASMKDDPSVSKEQSFTVKNSYKLHVVHITAGDSMILEANGHYGMIDVGVYGAYGTGGSSKIKTLLDKLGVTKLDFLILTHPHTDHIGIGDDGASSAANIINDYKPSKIYVKSYSDEQPSAPAKASYKTIINTAKKCTSCTLKVLGASSSEIESEYMFDQNKDRVFNLGAFNIKLYNLSNQLKVYKYKSNGAACGYASRANINSITQKIEIETNGYRSYTYLEGDLESSVCYNKNKEQIKNIIYKQVARDIGNHRIDVYKPGHHGKYNATTKVELNTLKPRYIFATSTKEKLEKTSYNKNVNGCTSNQCAINKIKNYLGSDFACNFRLNVEGLSVNNHIIFDYSNGTPTVTGGASYVDGVNISDCD